MLKVLMALVTKAYGMNKGWLVGWLAVMLVGWHSVAGSLG